MLLQLTSLASGGNRPDWLGGVMLTILAKGANRPDWRANNRLDIKINLTGWECMLTRLARGGC